MAAFTQWIGRSNILFAVVACIPEVCRRDGLCTASLQSSAPPHHRPS